MNIFDPIFLQASVSPNRPALAFPGGFVSYGQLASAATATANSLSAAGVQKGQLAAIDIANPAFQIITTVALGRLGISSINMPTSDPAYYSGLDVKTYIGDRPNTAFSNAQSITTDQNWFASKLSAKVQVPGKGIQLAPDEVCRVAVSSGTTGRPKAIALTAGCMETRLSRVTLNPLGTRTLSMLGMATAWGFLLCTRALRMGGTFCFAPFPEDVLDLCMLAEVREIWASPDQVASLVKVQSAAQRPLPALERVTIGGSIISPTLLAEATQTLCKNIVLTYGATETGPVASAPAAFVPPNSGAVGFMFPWVNIQIVDEHDHDLGFDREGVIRISGPEVISTYVLTDPDAEGVFKDGWFYPGDLAVLRKDGLLSIVGRTSEVINRGGVKIAPDVIEDALKAHPAISDAAATGMTNAQGVSEIWAAIVIKTSVSDADLQLHCAPRLANRSPDRFFRVQTIPRNQFGKVMRAVLRRQLEKENGVRAT
jgi:acyl-coenzyme A synthetase/AMP-(fatty) acid ligase